MAPLIFPQLLYSQPLSIKCCTKVADSEKLVNIEQISGLAHQLWGKDYSSPTVTVPPASAPSSLLPPSSTVNVDDGIVGILPPYPKPNPDIDSEDRQGIAAESLSSTYNIDREALELLLSSHAKTYVATTADQGLTITPLCDLREEDAQNVSYLKSRPRHAPIVVPVLSVVLLWMFVTWYGRRRTEQTRVVAEDKSELMG